jgi:hypothetical protein
LKQCCNQLFRIVERFNWIRVLNKHRLSYVLKKSEVFRFPLHIKQKRDLSWVNTEKFNQKTIISWSCVMKKAKGYVNVLNSIILYVLSVIKTFKISLTTIIIIFCWMTQYSLNSKLAKRNILNHSCHDRWYFKKLYEPFFFQLLKSDHFSFKLISPPNIFISNDTTTQQHNNSSTFVYF